MIRKLLVVGFSAFTIVGCASNPDKIDSTYVSPLKYRDYDCDQLAMEMDYVGQRTTRLYKQLEEEHEADQWQTGVGLILFWPALFALEGGDGPAATEYAQLKGEFEALRDVSVQKKCGVDSKSPQEIIDEYRRDKEKEMKDQRPLSPDDKIER